jgi:hypothetical protein
MASETLWHFTCDHAHAAIGNRGLLRPNAHPLIPELGPVIWLTSDPSPTRDAVGLSSTYITCDRMAYRYRAVDPEVVPWADARRNVDPRVVTVLESHGDPGTWWLASASVKAVLA